MLNHPLFLVAATVVGLILLTPFVSAGDSITLQEKNETKTLTDVQIDDIKRDGIEYYSASSGATKNKKGFNEVRGWTVDYAARSKDFEAGNDSVLKAQWGRAIAAFQRVVTAAPSTLEVHLSLVHIVECGGRLRSAPGPDGASGWDTVIRTVPQLAQRFPNSYYLAAAYETLGMAYQGKNQTTEAEAAFRQMAQLDPARGQFRLALVQYDQRKWSQARDQFKAASVTASQRNDAKTAEQADLYVAKCSVELGDWNTAKDLFIKLTESANASPEIIATAYLGVGEYHGSKAEFELAFMALAKAATVFKANLPPADLQRAFGLAAVAAGKLAGRGDWQETADRFKQEYERRYPRQPFPNFR